MTTDQDYLDTIPLVHTLKTVNVNKELKKYILENYINLHIDLSTMIYVGDESRQPYCQYQFISVVLKYRINQEIKQFLEIAKHIDFDVKYFGIVCHDRIRICLKCGDYIAEYEDYYGYETDYSPTIIQCKCSYGEYCKNVIWLLDYIQRNMPKTIEYNSRYAQIIQYNDAEILLEYSDSETDEDEYEDAGFLPLKPKRNNVFYISSDRLSAF